MSDTSALRIGTRGSPLALVQARTVMRLVAGVRGEGAVEERQIRTSGDVSQASGARLADIGGKGLFAKEIHEALLDGRVDMAVHSLKDLETILPPGIVLAGTLVREDPRDVLILGPGCARSDAAGLPHPALPVGALVGTSSVRRQAQLLHVRRDLRIEVIRGNVQSRLDKVRGGAFAASLLAMAGLRRLGLESEADLPIDPEEMVPAACQGIVGITIRERDADIARLLAAISDPDSAAAADAERALLGALDGSCHTPIGAHARLLPDDRMLLTGLVASADGAFLLKRAIECARNDAALAGADLGAELRRDSPPEMF